MTITTTLNRIRDHSPCRAGWEKLLKGLGKTAVDDEPLPFSRIVEINGVADAIWCMRVEPQRDQQWRLFVVFCCRQMQHLLSDQRSLTAIDVAERYAKGEATKEELEAAGEASLAAERKAYRKASRAAAREAARAASCVAAWDAAWKIAGTAAWEAAWIAAQEAPQEIERAAERTAAWNAAREAQGKELLRIVA